MGIPLNPRNKIIANDFLGASGNRSINYTATFFPAKKVSISGNLQD